MTVSAKFPYCLFPLTAGVSLIVMTAMPIGADAQTAPPSAFSGDSAELPLQLPAVEVTERQQGDNSREDSAENGYRAATQSVTPLGRMPLADTPYSINVTSGALIENSNAHDLVDAVKSNPTANMLMSSGGYSSMTRLMVRGFTAADQSELRDGLVDRSFSYPPVENVDRIEILNGFSSFFQGFASPGGEVNYVSKGPTAAPIAFLTLGDYGGGINFAHADLGGPVAGTDDKLGYRFNAYKEDGQTYLEGSRQKRALISAVANYQVSPGTVMTADIWHQDYQADGLQTYFANSTTGNWNSAMSGVPSASAFRASTQYGQDWTFNKAEKTLAGLRVESELNDSFSVRAGYRHGDMWRQYDYVSALSLTPGGTYVERNDATPRQLERTESTYDLADARFGILGIRHTLTAGYSGTYYFYERGNDNDVTLGNSNVSTPATYNNPQTSAGPSTSWSNVRYNSFLVGDHAEFSDQWSALIGGNRAEIISRAWTATSRTHYDQATCTPTYALMYKPVANVMVYASSMEALVNGGTAPSTAANANQILAPFASSQVEAGVKASLGGMDLNAALFRIGMTNQETDPRDNIYKQDGREIHQGLESTGTGKLTSQLTAIAGFTLMDAHVQKATADPLSDGKTPVNVPEQQASAYLEYALPWIADLSLTGGANYYGRRPVDTHDVAYLDGATVFNAGLRYEPEIYGHKTTVTLNVSNLFDTAYWAYYRSGDGLLLGAPRVVSLSVKASW